MKLKIVLFLIMVVNFSQAQDPIFTQFSLVPETLNPGFTGFLYNWRGGIIHRRQWPDGVRVMDTDYGFLNKMIDNNSALGMTILNQREAFTNYNYIQVNSTYSYKVELDYQLSFRPGIEVGYGRKNYNFQNLLLEDQINFYTGQIASSSIDQGILNYKENINFADISAGFVIDDEKGWIGASIKHLNRPNISFQNNSNVPLDLFLSIHAGYPFELQNTPSMIFPDNTKLLINFNYMRQSQFNRLDLGAALKLNTLIIGATMATNPEGKNSYSHFITSLNPYLSVHFDNFDFAYSYDASTSKIGHTQGIHEISLLWQLRFCGTCHSIVNDYYDYSK